MSCPLARFGRGQAVFTPFLSHSSLFIDLLVIYFLYPAPAPLPNLAEGRKFLNPLVVKTLEMHSFFISHLSSSLSMDWRRP